MCIERLLVPDTLRDTDVSVRLLVANSRTTSEYLQKRKGMDWRDGQQLTELIKGLESDGGKAGRMAETRGQAAGGTVSRARTPLLHAAVSLCIQPSGPKHELSCGQMQVHAWLTLPGPGI